MRVTATPPIVEARGVHKYFGALHVLKGVDLVVQEKELVFVIGPSGSGKSTLLRCLNRLEDPTDGSITVDGIDMLDRRTDINKARQRIGMVFQSFNLYPHMTALGNVALALRKVQGQAKPEADARAQAALDRVRSRRSRPTIIPGSFPAASSSGSRSPARSRWSRG